MSTKRAKLTADKARERVSSLEESIVSREQKLEGLRSRIARSATPDEKLLSTQQRLERRIELEKEQVSKLKRLLNRHEALESSDDAGDYGSEEIDDLHRSFEEVRQDLSQVKRRLESADIPRDLPTRLTSFEERITRREEVASDLYGQLLSMESALEQERQTVRRLSRKIREQDQSIDALREAVEESVVATVDLVERLEELEERGHESAVLPAIEEKEEPDWKCEVEDLRAQLEELRSQQQEANSSESEEILMEALNDFDSRLEAVERLAEATSERSVELAAVQAAQAANLPPEPTAPEPEGKKEVVEAAQDTAPETVAPPETPAPAILEVVGPANGREGWVPANFATGSVGGRLRTTWEVANFQGNARAQKSQLTS